MNNQKQELAAEDKDKRSSIFTVKEAETLYCGSAYMLLSLPFA